MSEKVKPTIVIGHKNPDTDSIVSAIAYANLKNKKGKGTFVAARAGEINEETKFVLDYFKAQAPTYINNIKTQVSDIEIRHTEGVNRFISLKRAWELMQNLSVVTLPAVDQNGMLEGLITVSDIAYSYMNVYDSDILAKAHTKYKNIIETLNAQIVVGDEADVFDSGRVVVSAANPDMMENIIRKSDLVILGNRYE
ncbi:MAG: DHH family phosphoesterase, partial [Phoenicibacter congonensis]|nr:DHH family phosphoesterase [Phoenicibacter congonensis]